MKSTLVKIKISLILLAGYYPHPANAYQRMSEKSSSQRDNADFITEWSTVKSAFQAINSTLQMPSYIAATNSGSHPKQLGCFSDSRTLKITTFPLQYDLRINGQSATRNMKAGIQFSNSCNGFWGVYEGPIDSFMSLEDGDGKVILGRGVIRRFGPIASNVVRDYSGNVRACISPPLERKYCTPFVQVSS